MFDRADSADGVLVMGVSGISDANVLAEAEEVFCDVLLVLGGLRGRCAED